MLEVRVRFEVVWDRWDICVRWLWAPRVEVRVQASEGLNTTGALLQPVVRSRGLIMSESWGSGGQTKTVEGVPSKATEGSGN